MSDHYDRYNGMEELLSTNLAELGTDAISRQAAINALKAIKYGLWEIDIPSPTVPEYVEHHEQIKNMMEIVDGWIERIQEEPPIQPAEPKRGKWIPSSGQCGISCSECGLSPDDFCYSIDYIELDYAPNFCPNCGADMRGEQDG